MDGRLSPSFQSTAPTRASTRSQRSTRTTERGTITRAGAGGKAILRIAELQLVQLTAQLAHLGALSGDLLAQQSRGEEDASQQQTGLDEREQRPVSHAADHAIENGDDAGEEAEQEEAGAHHAEEEQWLLAEAQLEPDGGHVEHADRDARQSELRLAGVPWVERHRDL